MKRFKGKKCLISFILCVCFSQGISLNAYCSENDENLQISNPKYSDSFVKYSQDMENGDIEKYNGLIPYPYDDITLTKSGGLDEFEEKYDPRTLGYMTPVKNQGTNEVCWAFAGIGALESYLKLKGYGEYDLSEEHLRWSATLDNDGKGWNRTAGEGGPTQIVPGYFLSANGPKLEKDIPYMDNRAVAPSNLKTAKNVIDVTDIEYVSDDINSVKKAIKENGAVETCYYDDSYYLSGSSYYYNVDKNKNVNHAVIIVGWDDNYSKDNFKIGNQPLNNGAWLVKNSWGSDKYDNGYIWISYEDYVILNGKNGNINYSIKKAEPSQNKDIKKYQYDENGAINECKLNPVSGNVITQAYYMNVFDFDENYRKIESVSFESGCIGAKYSIYYNPVYQNGMPNTNTNRMQLLASGTVDYSGYKTVELNGRTVNKGKGAIVVKLSNPSSSDGVSLGYETTVYYVDSNKAAYYSSANEGESFVMVKQNGNTMIEDMNGDNMKDSDGYSPRNFSIKVNASNIASTYTDLESIDDYKDYVYALNEISDKQSQEYQDKLNYLINKYNELSDKDKSEIDSSTRDEIEQLIADNNSSNNSDNNSSNNSDNNSSNNSSNNSDDNSSNNLNNNSDDNLNNSESSDDNNLSTSDNNHLIITVMCIIFSVFTFYSCDKYKKML